MSFFSAALSILFLAPCGSYQMKPEEILVSDLLAGREEYVGREVTVIGVISLTSSGVSLCDVKTNDICVDLAIPVERAEYAKKNNFKEVRVRGVYLEHGFKESGDSILFLPSRLLVKDMETE